MGVTGHFSKWKVLPPNFFIWFHFMVLGILNVADAWFIHFLYALLKFLRGKSIIL